MSDSNPAYISKVHLKGYKSIKDLEIDLQPGLNIIIGPNGSGKTNFLESLNYTLKEDIKIKHFSSEIVFEDNLDTFTLNYFTQQYLNETNKNAIRTFVKKSSKKNALKTEYNFITVDENKIYFNSEISTRILNDSKLSYLKYGIDSDFDSFFKSSFELSFNVEGIDDVAGYYEGKIKSYIRLASIFNSSKIVTSDITELIDFYRPQLSIKTELKKILAYYSPISNIEINKDNLRIGADHEYAIIIFALLQLKFKVNGNWLDWDNLSDGTKRIFYLITMIFSSNESIIAIEEPELGIHPNQLYKLIQFLKEQSKEKQIIITTHSPEVLNILGEDELDRIIVTRYDGEKGTKMYKLSEKEQTHVRNYMKHQASISDYWIQSGFEKENEEEVTS